MDDGLPIDVNAAQDRLRILVIDDDQADRHIVRRLLQRRPDPMEIIERGDAIAAMEMADDDIDVILLDYFLPGQTGLDCLQKLQQRWPWAAIVLMTGQGDEALAKRAIQTGATDYLPKRALSEGSLWRAINTSVEHAFMRWRIAEQQEELSQFAAMMVHDFKAPVRAVLFGCETIREDLAEGNPEGLKQGLGMLERSAQQMRDLLTALGEHIRFDQDALTGTIDVSAAIAAATAALKLEIEEVGATLKTDLHAAPMRGSTAQLSQVLQNLIANALKYRSQAAPLIEIMSFDTDQDSVDIIVRDNGRGIPPEQREIVFEPFRRGVSAEQERGIGLGLATCRRVIQRHGGEIWCTGNDHAGTDVHIRLPRNGPPKRPRPGGHRRPAVNLAKS